MSADLTLPPATAGLREVLGTAGRHPPLADQVSQCLGLCTVGSGVHVCANIGYNVNRRALFKKRRRSHPVCHVTRQAHHDGRPRGTEAHSGPALIARDPHQPVQVLRRSADVGRGCTLPAGETVDRIVVHRRWH